MNQLLFRSLAIFLFSFLAISVAGQDHIFATGTYTSGKSRGIYLVRFNSRTGKATVGRSESASNPSFLALSPDKKFLYSVNELSGANGNGGTISAYRIDSGGKSLKLINVRSTRGNLPCYVSVDKTGKWVFVANYGTGSFTSYQVQPDGSLSEPVQTISDKGKGPDKQRQDGPHMHAVLTGRTNEFLYTSDLGNDLVSVYLFNAANGQITFFHSASLKPGAGPRHLEFSSDGNWLYVMEELGGSVDVFRVKHGKLTPVQTISYVEAGNSSRPSGADIHLSPDGLFLYVSNRGETNGITIFSREPRNGKLAWKGFQSTLGKKPRNFSIDPSGKSLLVANQDSDQVVVFNRDSQTGMLTDSKKRITVPAPVCILWLR
jgi:6-phosphogluconolactonase